MASEPTIRLPLHTHRDYWWFEDVESGQGFCLACRVNSQAERIRGLEEALQKIAQDTVGEWRSSADVLRAVARAALDKAGKEGA